MQRQHAPAASRLSTTIATTLVGVIGTVVVSLLDPLGVGLGEVVAVPVELAVVAVPVELRVVAVPVELLVVAVPVELRVAVVAVAGVGVGVTGGKKPHCDVQASKSSDMFSVTLFRTTRVHVNELMVRIVSVVVFPAQLSWVKNVS